MKNKNRMIASLIFRRIRIYHIIAITIINMVAYLYSIMDYMSYEQTGLAKNIFLYTIGDRFTVFIISGIILVVLFSTALKDIVHSEEIRIRLKSHINICLAGGIMILAISFVMLTMQFIMVALAAIIVGSKDIVTYQPLVSIKLYFNSLLLYITIGCLTMLFNFYISKEKIANTIIIVILVMNAIVSGGTAFMSNVYSKILFVGHIFTFSLGVDSAFWLTCIIILGALCVARPYWVRKRSMGVIKNLRIYIIMTIAVFVIYGLVAETEVATNAVAQYFDGFLSIDRYLIMYLFYQLPLWIFVYHYMTERFNSFGVYYAMRHGSIKRFLLKIGATSIICVFLYYFIGIICLALINAIVLGKNSFGEYLFEAFSIKESLGVINLILQTILILQLSFIFWVLKSGASHIGFVLIIILHIFFTIIAANNMAISAWIPLTQGINYLSRGHQLFSIIYQCVLLLGGDVIMLKLLENKQYAIFLRRRGV